MKKAHILPLIMISAALCLSCSKKSEEVKPPEEPSNAQDAATDKAEAADEAKPAEAAADPGDGQAPDAAAPDEAPKEAAPAVRSARKPVWQEYRPLKAKTPGAAQNPLLRNVPGSSFFILASTGSFDYQRQDFDAFVRHLSTLVIAQLKQIPEPDAPFDKSVVAMFRGILKNLSSNKLKSLGLSGDFMGHFAFYFVHQTPVLKISLTDADKFKEIVESYWKQNGIEARTPTELSTAWSLIRIDDAVPTELALHWDIDDLTITVVSDDEHAGKLLPDITATPADGKSAVTQLSNIDVPDTAYAAGILDLNAMLNQLVLIQEQSKKLLGNPDSAELDKRCVKDMHRIASAVPRIQFRVMPVSSGVSFGLDTQIRFELQNTAWIKDIQAQSPQFAPLPKAQTMSLAEFSLSLPVKQITSVIAAYRDAVKLDPFTCPWLSGLNDIDAEMIGELTAIPQFSEYAHHVGAILYEGTIDHPRKYAASYRSDKAAEMASLMHIIASEKLNSAMNPAGDGPVPEGEPADGAAADKPADGAAADKPADGAAADKPADGETGTEKPAGPEVYDDARLVMDGAPKGMLLKVMSNAIAVASEDAMLSQIAAAPLKPADSLVRFEISERLMDEQDFDPDTDFRVGVSVSARENAVDVTLRYVLE